ncbi:MAG: cell division protein FtsA [Minisyncoccia bacterium]
MARQVSTGIDIGTSEIRVVIAEIFQDNGKNTPRIIGTGSSESRGVYRGYITNVGEAAKSLEVAIRQAEKTAGLKVKNAYVGFGGIGLGSVVSTGSVTISRADMEITEKDIEAATEAAGSLIPPAASINRKILNTAPIEYKIDGKTVWGQALGLKAQKLEVKALFINCLEHHLADLFSVVEEAGVEVSDVVASPLAESLVTLTKKQKRAGCLLADLGAETLSVMVFENNNILSLEVFPFGGNDITNDIALGLKISPENAEELKIGHDRGLSYPKKKLEEIIASRLREVFGSVDNHLKAIGRNALLPAGIIIAGGSASLTGIKTVAESSLKLPSGLAEVYFGEASEGRIKNRTWAVACGLSLFGLSAEDSSNIADLTRNREITKRGKHWLALLKRSIHQFLP